jgi:hypothetical protein
MDRPLADLIDRCLEIDPAKRPRDAGAVLRELKLRELRRRRRPLLIAGFLAPLALLLVTLGIAVSEAHSMIRRSEGDLTRQLLQSNLVSARLVANVVQSQLEERMQAIAQEAESEELRTMVQRRAADLPRLLEKVFKKHEERAFRRWTVTDQNGIILAAHPPESTPEAHQRFIGQDRSGRDWYKGALKKAAAPPRTGSPLGRLHLSEPFVSISEDQKKCVGISTALAAPGDRQTCVGVLLVTISFPELQKWLDDVAIENGCAVLLNDRCQCLRHREGKESEIRSPTSEDRWPSWDSDVYRAAVGKAEGTAQAYQDPIDKAEGKIYMASYVPLQEIGWGVIIQHERGAALKPVTDLSRRMVRLGGIMLGIVVLPACLLWGWLFWSMRREERTIHG